MKEKKPLPTSLIYFDKYGVKVVDCYDCGTFIPNVVDDQIITCPCCKKNFIAIWD